MAIEKFNAAFKRWFRNSVVVNADGSPKILYHGSTAAEGFTVFRPSKDGTLGPGVYLTDDADVAGNFALDIYDDDVEPTLDNSRIIPVYARIERPLGLTPFPTEAQKELFQLLYSGNNYVGGRWSSDWRDPSYILHKAYKAGTQEELDTLKYDFRNTRDADFNNESQWRVRILYRLHNRTLTLDDILRRPRDDRNLVDPILNELRKRVPHDGIIGTRYDNKGQATFTEYVVLHPAQVKSIYNKGTWDLTDPDVLHGLSVFGGLRMR